MKKKRKNNSFRLLISSLREVFSNIWYWLITFIISGITLLFAIWLPNWSFLSYTVTTNNYTIGQKFSLLISSLGALNTNFTSLSRTLTIIVALLFGINMAILIYYIRKKIKLQRAAGLGGIGVLSGLIGIGCASCGSVILSSIFGIGATAGFIGILPLKGQEFGLLSIGILGFSIFLIAKKIQNSNNCNGK